MAELVLPSSVIWKGPFLISKNSLLKLDDVLDNIQKEFGISHTNFIVTVYLKNDKRIQGHSIDEIMTDRNIKELTPIALTVKLSDPDNLIELDVNHVAENRFKYNVNCSDKKQDKIIYLIEEWAEEFKPKWTLRAWKIISPISSTILGLMVIILLLAIIPSKRQDYKDTLNNEISSLLAQGINDSTINRAVELLLIKSIDYVPSDYKRHRYKLSIDWSSIPIWTCILLLILSLPPITCYDLGKGKFKYNLMKWWSKFVLVIIPSMIIVPLILNRLK